MYRGNRPHRIGSAFGKITLLLNISRKNTNMSKLRLKIKSEILKTSGGKRKPTLFRPLLISMTCTTSSKQQRLPMSRARITTLLSKPSMGHFWRMTLPFKTTEIAFRVALNRETVVTEHTIPSIPQHTGRTSLDILPIQDEVQHDTMQRKKP